jgi:cytochrome c
MTRSLRSKALCAALILCSAASAHADAKRGADVFDAECSDCHSVANPPKNKKGPSLYGVLGRGSAQMPGYQYSDAMKASGIVWTADKLDAYVSAPRKTVPGGKMKYDGLDDAAQRADLIDFLGTLK